MVHRSKAERARDRVFIEELYCKRVPIREIAERLTEAHYKDRPLSKSSIGRDIKEIDADWLEREKTAVAKRKAKDLAGIDRIISEAWTEWERSKQDKKHQELIEESGVVAGVPGRTKQRKVAKVEGRLGDANYFMVILKAMERGAKLLGMDAPTAVDLGDAGRLGMAHMLAMAQNADEYAKTEGCLPPEAYEPLPEPETSTDPES